MQTHETLLNPLIQFRHKLNLTQSDLAREVGLTVVLIQLQEKGIPHHLHPRFLKAFPDVIELIPAYQDYRVEVRKANWPRGTQSVPEIGPEFADFLRGSGLSVAQFSERACMPIVDINYALHHYRIPSTIRRFFEEINS